MHEPELHLGEDILAPDVAGWRRERLPRIQETWDEVIAPDWVCETVADSTRELDLNGKRPVYAREGIPHPWLVEPTDRTLEAFELQEGRWVLIASVKDDDLVSIRPFDAITFSLSVPPELLAHISPLGWAHILLTGEYRWPRTVADTPYSVI